MVQFRKTKTAGIFRGTLSKRGVGVSVGAGPIRYSVGADGKTRRTIRAPGTGVYSTQVVGDKPDGPTVEQKRHPWLIAFTVLALLFLLTMILI